MKLYENVVIGNFLYTLGFSIGSKSQGNQTLSVVNLLQQTPEDKRLADALLQFQGTVKLIEFKNRAGSLKKEKDKHARLVKILTNNAEFTHVSREIHWYIETNPYKKKCVNKIVPYLDAFDEVASVHTLESMVDEISNEAFLEHPKVSLDECQAYLKLIASHQGGKKSGSSETTGGLLVALNGTEVTYLQYTDILDLRLTAKQFSEKVKTQEQSLMKLYQEQEKKHELERTIERPGLSR
ncbi:hypothetical protein [Pseudoalteromonas sp. OF7H-1]|uniref:hypothetical protein n=1 Tax=Pseudoalteromonas sp. OF7H-1 TaxID=2917755 RepID=UPI001EF5087B|nr:hypothetical protein [Pseudoalteromonas sp. OF7H-1]MCG7539038.1 hypothetical protein [Pseudoalteromonas sp. OF7H-1]